MFLEIESGLDCNPMPTRTESIKNFLDVSTLSDLASVYNHDMEVQVNVARDTGERVEGEYHGRRWQGWTDGIQTWKSFRIPYKANTEPEYEDRKMTFDLAAHVEAIGMTGWDWKSKVSKWVAFDFDAITGHSDKHEKKLTNEELKEIRKVVTDISWITVRHSTGGKGLHLYVTLDDVPTSNHNEHAALARAILGKLAAVTGHDFQSKVDICGGNMWIWHRKMRNTNGLEVIKEGTTLYDIPTNWNDHVKVVSGKRQRALPTFVEESNQSDVERLFDELSGQRTKIELDEEHKKLIGYLETHETQWTWDQDNRMLICHTYDLKVAHETLGFKGIFQTTATGKEQGQDQNCFAFPLRRGGWAIRRYTPGVNEADTWEQDGNGWTRCYYNVAPNLKMAAKAHAGIEDEKGAFNFREASIANKTAEALGVSLGLPTWASSRRISLKEHKDGRLVAILERDNNDTADDLKGWLADKTTWKKIFSTRVAMQEEPETGNYDDTIRHLISETGEDLGWVLRGDGIWKTEPLQHIKAFLVGALGLSPKESNQIIGSSVAKCWSIVNRPFQPEYIGDRKWNRGAAQLRYLPNENTDNLSYPTWLAILNHCGSGLDKAIEANVWAKANGIISGADYLKCWIASLFKEPEQPLPYLFFYSEEQNTGKSIFHEALALLMTHGAVRADQALMSSGGFNAEIANAVLCIVEETDLRRNQIAGNRIKDWVTSLKLSIHAKGRTPYGIPNTTHWVQCANSIEYCPIFPGDSRITMSEVDPLDPLSLIPKKAMIPLLEKEAPDFLAEIFALEIPQSNDRLNVPVITTQEKLAAEDANKSFLDAFIHEECFHVTGGWIKFSEFYERFIDWLKDTAPGNYDLWSKNKTGRSFPKKHPKGRSPKDNHVYVGNIAWEPLEPDEPAKPELVLNNGKLVPK